jgi:hypothetical protein
MENSLFSAQDRGNLWRSLMLGVQRVVGVVAVLLFVTLWGASAQTIGSPLNLRLDSYAQAEKETVTTRITKWTKSKLAAAKKRWAQNQEKFSDCSKQLAEKKKATRISLHKQGDFLQDCMNQKP